MRQTFTLAVALLAAATPMARALILNGDFESWTSGNLDGWEHYSAVVSTKVSGFNGSSSAVRIGYPSSGGQPTTSLRQTLTTRVTGAFTFQFDFQNLAIGNSPSAGRIMNVSLRQANIDPLIIMRSTDTGVFELFDGTAWQNLGTSQTAPFNTSDVYRITIAGSVGNAASTYSVSLSNLTDHASVGDVGGLSWFFADPSDREIAGIYLERGRSQSDYVIDNVSMEAPEPPVVSAGAPDLAEFLGAAPIASNSAPVSFDSFTQLGFGSVLYNINKPRGAYRNGITYIAFQGDSEDPFVTAYNHRLGRWSDPFRVGVSTLANGDGHGNPAIIFDQAGYLHCVFGGHGSGRPMKHYRTTRPEDITEWQEIPNISSDATYPQLARLSDGTLLYFYRAGNHNDDWVLVSSTDNGLSWSTPQAILDAGSVDSWYCFTQLGADDIMHLGFSYHWHGTPYAEPAHAHERFNTYYLRRRPSDGIWENIEGTTVSLPVTKAVADTAAVVNFSADGDGDFDNDDLRTDTPAIAVTPSGDPIILLRPGSGTSFMYTMARWNGTSWVQTPIVESDHIFDYGNLIALTDTHYQAFVIRGATDGTGSDVLGDNTAIGGNLERWESTDSGATWTRQEVILDDSEGKVHFATAVIDHHHANAKLVTYERASGSLGNQDVYVWGEGGLLGKSYNREVGIENLCLTPGVTAIDGAASPVAGVIDGNNATSLTLDSFPAEITITLEAPKTISAIQLQNADMRAIQYRVYTSPDGTEGSFGMVANHSANRTGGPVLTTRFAPHTAKAVRIEFVGIFPSSISMAPLEEIRVLSPRWIPPFDHATVVMIR